MEKLNQMMVPQEINRNETSSHREIAALLTQDANDQSRIPGEYLAKFNRNIIGKIEVIAECH
jgi:hypothetical protein